METSPAPLPPRESDERTSSEAGSRPRALLICRDAGCRKWGPRWLERAGLETTVITESGEAAAAMGSLAPALVIVDAAMKDTGGVRLFETLSPIAGETETPLLVLCSSHKEIRLALDAGATDVIRRPLDWQVVSRRAALLSRAFQTTAELDNVRTALEKAMAFAEEAYQSVQRRASTDDLTELPNRKVFRRLIERALSAPRPAGAMVAVLVLDLDRFSAVNETAGRELGNTVLAQVGARLRSALKQSDWIAAGRPGLATAAVARLGGDQFGVLATNIGGVEDLSRLALHLQGHLGDPIEAGGRSFYLSASLGSALFPSDADDADRLIQHAETAMLEAKQLGGGLFRFYREALNRASDRKLEIDRQLRRALERDELVLHYQPLVDFIDGRVVGAEALLRWNHPRRGLLGPMEFIPVAEETGLMASIGCWVIDTACRQLREWMDQGLPLIHMATNVSLCQFRRGNLVETVRRALRDAALEPRSLELELSERGVLRNDPEILDQLEELKRLGVRLSIDDFGTGDSAIAYLKMLPVDVLKIDRSYVHGALLNERDAAITSAMVAMAQRLKLTVVAEGIETDEELRLLKELGCNQFQGFHFSPAVSANEFCQFLISNRHPRTPRRVPTSE